MNAECAEAREFSLEPVIVTAQSPNVNTRNVEAMAAGAPAEPVTPDYSVWMESVRSTDSPVKPVAAPAAEAAEAEAEADATNSRTLSGNVPKKSYKR